MTEEQIVLVRRSWKMFRGVDPSVVGDTFYSKLFSDAPSVRRMFPSKMEDQYKKLMDMLSTIVARLDRMNEMKGEIAAMGRRHANYGVKPAHYQLVGQALLWTLEQGLGRDWTPELATAWETCYRMISDTMINASELERQ